MRRAVSTLIWVVLGAVSARAAETAPKLPDEYQTLLGFAYASPPEVAADAILRVAASSKIPAATRRDVIEQAFRLAGSAGNAIPLRQLPRLSADTRSGSLDRASRLKLDALSLQTRAVLAMLPVDKAKARELFSQLPVPAPAGRTCEDALVWDPADYYVALVAVADEAFSAAERRKNQHLAFLRARLAAVASPSQVPAMAKAIASVKLADEERPLLAASFATALDTVPTDPRSYQFYIEDAEREVGNLGSVLATESPSTAAALKTAFQKYTAGQLAARQCAESQVLDFAAILRRREGKDPGPKPVAAQLHSYWTTAGAKLLAERALALRWGPSGQPVRMLSEEERAKPEWHTALAETLSLMDTWRRDPEETEADYYHQRTILYQALVDLTPPGRLRDGLMREFVRFVANSNLQRELPVEWLCRPLELLSRFGPAGENRKLLLSEFAESGNPVLSLVTELERMLPTGPPGMAPRSP